MSKQTKMNVHNFNFTNKQKLSQKFDVEMDFSYALLNMVKAKFLFLLKIVPLKPCLL